MEPKVSVIMPAYNAERFIEKSINSLLAQTLQDWELIVVDDGSTDSTSKILEKFTDIRIHVFHQENGGEASARNTGLQHVKAEYIALLDADDQYLPNALEDLSSYLDANPEFDVVYSEGQICDEEDRPLMRLNEIRPGFYTGRILEHIVLTPSIVTVPVCTMTRISRLREHSIHFDTNLVIGTDWDFWIQIAVHCSFGFLDKLTCLYRVHNSNITKRVDRVKRKRDRSVGRLKVMNSTWFDKLSIATRERLVSELLTNSMWGNPDAQRGVLTSNAFARLPLDVRARLWRLVGMNSWRAFKKVDVAQPFFHEALNINPSDQKTRLIVQGLKWMPRLTLHSMTLLQWFLEFKRKLTSSHYNQAKRLQGLFGLK